jgi:site-specific recombinase XerD
VINASIRDALEKYVVAYPQAAASPDHFCFFSSKRSGPNYTRPLSRIQAWRLIAEVCQSVGLSGNYGTHSLRKTWGYHARQNGAPLELIMAKLNHSNIAMTKRYLGITDDELRLLAEGLNL